MIKMKRICFFIMIIFLLGSCKFSVRSSDNNKIVFDYNYYNDKKFTYMSIPDKYNFGPDLNVSFNRLNEDGLVNGVYIKIDTRSDKTYIITSYIPKEVDEMPSEVTISNYDFSDANFKIYNPDRYSEEKHIKFVNCKFKGFANCGPYDENKCYFTFDHCSFCGGVNEVNITLNWCTIGHFESDAMNPLKNFTAQYCYIYDLACEGNSAGKHIDGFQIYGRGDTLGGNILIDNVRFEMPSINFGENTPAINACVMYQLEYGDVSNCTFSNLICNGGGKWYPLYFKKTKCKKDGKYFKQGDEFPERNAVLKNVKVSNNFGTIFYPTEHYENAVIENVNHFDKLYVSSIFIDNKGNTHVICTNDTSIDKILTVKTENGDYTFEIPHCPSNWALGGEIDKKVNPDESLTDNNGRSYTTYKFEDMPFDIDCEITCNCNSVKCYDNETLIAEVK